MYRPWSGTSQSSERFPCQHNANMPPALTCCRAVPKGSYCRQWLAPAHPSDPQHLLNLCQTLRLSVCTVTQLLRDGHSKSSGREGRPQASSSCSAWCRGLQHMVSMPVLCSGARGARGAWSRAKAQVWQRARRTPAQRTRLSEAEPRILGRAGLRLLHDYSLHCRTEAEISTHGTCRLVLQRLWGAVSAACHVTVCLEECAGVSFRGLLGLSCPVFPWKSPFCLQGPGKISGQCKALPHTAHAGLLPAASATVSAETSAWG